MGSAAREFAERVLTLGSASAYQVAFSGGPDSHVLLHALASMREWLPAPLAAIHVNHRMTDRAEAWADHCRDVCQTLDVPLTVCRAPEAAPVDAAETWARELRYRLFADAIGPSELLLTAHHRDDQAETVLLRLLRGAGMDGLAAIPRTRQLGTGRVGRPLLDVPRSRLRAYAAAEGLQSVDDPTNRDESVDRNFIRHQVMPLLTERWPAAPAAISRTGTHASEGRQLLERYADRLAADAINRGQLDCTVLAALPGAEQRLLLRYWLRRRGRSLPNARQLEAGRQMLVESDADRMPVFHWPGGTIRRYRGWLMLDSVGGAAQVAQTGSNRCWIADSDLRLAHGWLRVEPGVGGLNPDCLPSSGATIVLRRGGERCRPVGRPSRPVKKLFQEAGIPPWRRSSWPLLMVDGVVVAVPGICICDGFQADPPGRGVHLSWDPD